MSILSKVFAELPALVDAPTWVVLLLKATAILSVAWCVHWALKRANPRWRVFNWRVTALAVVGLPAMACLLPSLPFHVKSPIHERAAGVSTAFDSRSVVTPENGAHIERGANFNARGEIVEAGVREILPPPFTHEARNNRDTTTAATGKDIAPQEVVAQSVPDNIWEALNVNSVLVAVWLGVMAVLSVRLIIGHYRVRRVVSRAIPPAQSIQRLCARVALAVDCHARVAVLESADISSPLLCGMFRPRLLLPARMCDAIYLKDLPGILAHELAHARSHDVLWNVGLQLISIVLWFHPLIWRMRQAHLEACELICDAVSASLVGDVTDYCRTLARVAVEASRALPAAGIAMARTSAIGRRLSALKEKVFHSPLRRRSVVGVGVIAMLTVLVVGTLRFAAAAPPAAEPTAASKATSAKRGDETLRPARNDKSHEDAKDAEPNKSLIRVRVVDEAGRPLADANVHSSICTEEKGSKPNRDYTTNADGIAVVELPKSYFIVRLWAGKKSFVTMFSHWEQNELSSGTKLPAEYTIPLERAVSAGGRIVDEHGKPIAGARVEVTSRGGETAKRDGRTGYSTWLALKNADPKVGETPAPTTDADGRWRIDNVPKDDKCELTLQVSHPDYMSDDAWGKLQKDAGITTAMLRSQTAILTMKRGIIVRGRVTQADGKPVKEALVVLGNDPYFASTTCEFPIERDGTFRLPAVPPGEQLLTVIAPGWAPQQRRVNVTDKTPPQDFRMEPGKPIRLQFVDTAGKPIPEVHVNIQQWRGTKSICNIRHPKVLDTKIPERADKQGVWQWTWAPNDPIELRAYSYPLKGYAPCDLEVAGGTTRTVVLKAEHRITGRVTDAVTGKPIPEFAIIPIDVFRKDWQHAERYNAKLGKEGRLDYLADRTDIPLRLRIEAMGYRTQTGPEFRVGDDAPRTQNFPLQPSEPVTGEVVDDAGKPVAKAEVTMATPSSDARLFQANDSVSQNQRTFSDSKGRFSFPDPGEPYIVLAQADGGFAMAEVPLGEHDAGTLRLRSWASVRGQFRDGGKPVKNAHVLLQPVRVDSLARPRINAMLQATTDADGRFDFTRVPPGPVSVRVSLGPWREEGFRSGPSVPLALQPKQKVELALGSGGATVDGKVTLAGKVPAGLDCSYSLNYLIAREPGIAPPPDVAAAGFDIRNGWRDAWSKTAEGHAYLSTLRHWFVKLAPDGDFRISGVPAGDYDLAIEIYAKPSGCLVDPLARKVVRITVTPEDAACGELKLPEITATVVPAPAVGDVPSLSFQFADGSTGSLSDFRGRQTIVHFWASWCGPCKQQLPAMRQLHERLAARGVAVLGISLDENAEAWQAALKQLDLPWQQGRVKAGETLISSVPTYWLLDPAGKLIAKAADPAEFSGVVEAAQPKETQARDRPNPTKP